ncbi:MAG TPA: amino acid--[acyl-carrier-protein] ligase [Gemmatimonadaceae bacterium]|jgi:seryl-tRNA synthetase|nr:amino acid--[acyl-carrier-protein] ligase [Gemmatimonadaceae bacterium]
MTNATLPDVYQEYLDALLESGLLIASGVPGVYGKGQVFEDILDRVNRGAAESGRDLQAEVLSFPPVLNKKLLEKTGYLQSFPHLTGTVHSFFGNEHDHAAVLDEVAAGEAWTARFSSTDVVLCPASCYPVYPYATGTLPVGGRTIDVQSYCFRHEPSGDPARLQSFRMHEFVRLGLPDDVQAFRDMWLDRGQVYLKALGLDVRAEVANDPFFGRGGKILAESQRGQALKFELVVPICSTERPTALVSCNYHQDHFAQKFDIKTSDGECAHSACVGFGLERITLALFKTHGLTPATWPVEVRRTLGL